MESFKDFCDSVLKSIPRATSQERTEIRLELTDHLLEHRDMLVDHGVEILQAERQAIKAMGDAGEIGRAWNEKLSPFWLWAGRVCMIACIFIGVFCMSSVFWRLETIWNSAMIRNADVVDEQLDDISGYELFWQADPGIKGDFGQHVIRIHRVALWKSESVPRQYRLQVYTISYPQDPFQYPLSSNILMGGLESEDVIPAGGGGSDDISRGYAESRYNYEVEKGLEAVDFTLEHLGNTFHAHIELDWGGVDG